VFARDTDADTPLRMSAPLALPASARSPHAGDHLATCSHSSSSGCTSNIHCLSRCASHSRPRDRGQRQCSRETPTTTPFTPCPRAPTSPHVPRRLHQQPPLPVALCLAQPTKRGKPHSSQETPAPIPLLMSAPLALSAGPYSPHAGAPFAARAYSRNSGSTRNHHCLSRRASCIRPTKRGKHQCSQETPALTPLFSWAHPLPFQQVRAPRTQVTPSPRVHARLHQQPPPLVALCLAQSTERRMRQYAQEIPAPTLLFS
jgi:hypothetical protein